MSTFEPKIPIAAITDEFSPDLPTALTAMKEIGMTAAELRTINGKNILDLSREELQQAKDTLVESGLSVIGIASPVFKCVLENGPAVDDRFQQDVFASRHTFADQPELLERAVSVAKFFGAPVVRVFSYWRTVEPERCQDAITQALERAASFAVSEQVIIGLENEHACNIGTAAEAAGILSLVAHPNLQLVWDPANALVAGESPFPEGYSLLPKNRIAHVHAKDCHMQGDQPIWGPLGTRHVRWREQVAALLADGYSGFLSLETHWRGPAEDKLEGSRICGWNLRGLAAA